MRNLLHLLIVAIAIATTANARLGETESELTQRFGRPTFSQPEQIIAQGKFITIGTLLTFRQDDWTITATIIEGRSAKETYSKPGEWSEDQFRTVLNANAQAATWTDTSEPTNKKIIRDWRRKDGGTGTWRLMQPMTVANPAFYRAKDKAESVAKANAKRVPKI